MGYPNVGYNALVSIDGLVFPYSACSLIEQVAYNPNPPLKPVGPTEVMVGPTKVTGTITLPVFGAGPCRFSVLKSMIFSIQAHTIWIMYGYDIDAIPIIFRFDGCVVHTITMQGTAGSHVTCTLEIIAKRAYPDTWRFGQLDLSDISPSLVAFNRTGITSYGYPSIVYDDISGWQFTVTRNWEEYWGWNNYAASIGDLSLEQIRPGNIQVAGEFSLISPQPIRNPCELRFNIGQVFDDDNYIHLHRVLYEVAAPEITAPHDRIHQIQRFIAVSDGVNGMINGEYNSIAS